MGLPSKFGARLHGSGAFSEETIAAAALLDYEALTRKAAELRFSTLQPPGEFVADSSQVRQHLTPENCHRRGQSGLAAPRTD